jgi:hypothetical protein
MQMRDIADLAFAAAKRSGDAKLNFKGRAYKNAADVSGRCRT